MVKTSNLTWENIDIITLERFIAVTIDRSELKSHRIDECIPVPEPRTTLNSWVNPTQRARETNSDSQFRPKTREAT